MNDVVDQVSLLENLSDADKDALITRLWRDLQEERARSKELERRLACGTRDLTTDDREANPLLKRLQQVVVGKRGARQLTESLNLRPLSSFAFLRSRRLVVAGPVRVDTIATLKGRPVTECDLGHTPN